MLFNLFRTRRSRRGEVVAKISRAAEAFQEEEERLKLLLGRGWKVASVKGAETERMVSFPTGLGTQLTMSLAEAFETESLHDAELRRWRRDVPELFATPSASCDRKGK